MLACDSLLFLFSYILPFFNTFVKIYQNEILRAAHFLFLCTYILHSFNIYVNIYRKKKFACVVLFIPFLVIFYILRLHFKTFIKYFICLRRTFPFQFLFSPSLVSRI